MQNQNHGQQNQNKLFTATVLRGVVALYLACLGYKIISNDKTEMSASAAWLFGIFFILAAAAVGVYTILRLRSDLHQTDPDKPAQKETDDDPAV